MKEIEDHHIHPKFMDNPKGLGLKRNIAKGEHIKLHLIISSIIWKFVPENLKQDCIDEVKIFSESYIRNLNNHKINRFTNDYIKKCPICGNEYDIEDKYCEHCYLELD